MNNADDKKEDTGDANDHQDIYFFESAKFWLDLTNGIARVLGTNFFDIYRIRYKVGKCGQTFQKLSYLKVHTCLCYIRESEKQMLRISLTMVTLFLCTILASWNYDLCPFL